MPTFRWVGMERVKNQKLILWNYTKQPVFPVQVYRDENLFYALIICFQCFQAAYNFLVTLIEEAQDHRTIQPHNVIALWQRKNFNKNTPKKVKHSVVKFFFELKNVFHFLHLFCCMFKPRGWLLFFPDLVFNYTKTLLYVRNNFVGVIDIIFVSMHGLLEESKLEDKFLKLSTIQPQNLLKIGSPVSVFPLIQNSTSTFWYEFEVIFVNTICQPWKLCFICSVKKEVLVESFHFKNYSF